MAEVYETTFVCDGCGEKCRLFLARGDGIPCVCPFGKNITGVLAGTVTKWELKQQRYKTNGQ